jgi:aerobic carbon-monoxide dehydrogenase large subunit
MANGAFGHARIALGGITIRLGPASRLGGITMTYPGIGSSPRRREDDRLVRGAGTFGDDFALPGQAFAAIARSPHAHAILRRIETTWARRMPGVLAVLTAADYLADGLKPLVHSPFTVSPPDITLSNRNAKAVFVAPHYPLACDRVRFVGEGVALIVAQTLATAKEAVELLEVDYEVLAARPEGVDAARSDAVRIWPDMDSNVALDAAVGDAQAANAAFERAAHVVCIETKIPRVTGVPLEVRTALAAYDPQSGRITLYAGGGGVVRAKLDLAHMLDLEPAKVRVIAKDVGGNFGTRNNSYPEFSLVAWAARRLGRPVKWTGDRTEAFLSDYHGRDLTVSAELALDASGKFLALRASNLSNIGAYAISFVPLTKGTELMSSIYHVPTVSVRARAVYSNSSPTVPYRSAGRPEVMFVIERLIDRAAHTWGFDRLLLRRMNMIPPHALPYVNPFGMTYDSGLYEKVFDDAVSLADWPGFETRRAVSRTMGLHRGIGIGCYIESASGAPYEQATVKILPCNAVTVTIGTLSAGQGHETSFVQLASEWLGVAPETVTLITGDTDLVIAGGGSHSGRSMRHAATTIRRATEDILAKGRRIAACLLGADAGAISFAEGRFSLSGSNRSVDLFEVASAAVVDDRLPLELRGSLQATGNVDSRVSSFPYGCHVAEVEIDVDTGQVWLTRYTAIDDVGRAVNKLIVEGQTHGGIAQGVGEALMERCIYDSNGQLLTASFMDYAMPRARDLPMFATAISEVPSTTHPLGLRGGGEGGITPALGVIANAIVDGLREFGVTHIDLPATPERIWRAIQDARTTGRGLDCR